jgi:hypothetical protein
VYLALFTFESVKIFNDYTELLHKIFLDVLEIIKWQINGSILSVNKYFKYDGMSYSLQK